MRDHLGQFALAGNMGFTRGIYLLDDCEGTMNWLSLGTGSDFAVAYTTAAALVGTNGLQMDTKATTPAANDYVMVYRRVEVPASNLLVFRVRVQIPDTLDLTSIALEFFRFFDVDLTQWSVRYVASTGSIDYLDAASAWVGTGETLSSIASAVWHTFELQIDLGRAEYREARFGGRVIDLSGVGAELTTDLGGGEYLEARVRLIGNGTSVCTAYLDQIYLGEFLDI